VAKSDRPAEIGDRMLLLDQHRTEPVRGRVALDNELLREVGQRQDRGRRDGELEGLERSSRVFGPCETLFLQERRKGCRDGAVAVDELAVVACQPEETTHRSSRTGLGPVMDRLDLRRIHGHTGRGYDMAEVGDGIDAESALGALDEEAVLAQHVEHRTEVPEMIRPR